jgi:hypothetical protein
MHDALLLWYMVVKLCCKQRPLLEV